MRECLPNPLVSASSRGAEKETTHCAAPCICVVCVVSSGCAVAVTAAAESRTLAVSIAESTVPLAESQRHAGRARAISGATERPSSADTPNDAPRRELIVPPTRRRRSVFEQGSTSSRKARIDASIFRSTLLSFGTGRRVESFASVIVHCEKLAKVLPKLGAQLVQRRRGVGRRRVRRRAARPERRNLTLHLRKRANKGRGAFEPKLKHRLKQGACGVGWVRLSSRCLRRSTPEAKLAEWPASRIALSLSHSCFHERTASSFELSLVWRGALGRLFARHLIGRLLAATLVSITCLFGINSSGSSSPSMSAPAPSAGRAPATERAYRSARSRSARSRGRHRSAAAASTPPAALASDASSSRNVTLIGEQLSSTSSLSAEGD